MSFGGTSIKFAPKAWTEFAGFVGRECAGVLLAIDDGCVFLSLATGFSTTAMAAEEPFSLPLVAFTGVSVDNPAPGDAPFIRVPLIGLKALGPGVSVAADRGTGLDTGIDAARIGGN